MEYRLLGDLTLRGILHPKGSTVELDEVRDAQRIAWLRRLGVLPAEGQGVVAHGSNVARVNERPALRPWPSGCCGGRR